MRPRLSAILLILLIAHHCFPQTWPSSLVGHWTFDNASNPFDASTGNDLQLTGSHICVNGPSTNDGAIGIDTGSYLACSHDILPNGGGALVNEYSLLFDVMITDPKVYHCLFQTSMTNSNDGDLFINPFSQTGIGYTGYSGFSIKAGQWYRMVITIDLGNYFRYYIDGKLIHQYSSDSQDIDGRFSLDPQLLFFADDNGEDNMIYVARVAVFNSALSKTEVKGLGGYHNSLINPYLQSPAPTSMIVCWNAYDTLTSGVDYGTTVSLGNNTQGSFEDIGATPNAHRWHSVKLTDLLPDTRYYYRCINDNDTSGIYSFHTPPLPSSAGKHIRFIKLGDSQTYVKTSTGIADTVLFLMKQLYGNQWADSISFVMHTGDILELGYDLGRYMNEYFNPYSGLSPYIPFMVSIGNHEVESQYYYQFVKYEDLGGYDERYYSFTLSNCRFIALNTNTSWQTQTQWDWLKSELDSAEADTSIDFVFCYFHHPGQSEIWPASNTSYVENDIYHLQQGYRKIVMNTFGHSHNYERGTQTTQHNGNWDFRNIICGGAGGALDRWGMYSGQVDLPDVQVALDHYCFMLVDIDVDNLRVDAVLYSLGHPDKPRNLEVLDRWHWYPGQPAPSKPMAISPANYALDMPELTASAFSGQDSLMTSRFQLVEYPGDFDQPLLDITRDHDNYFGDTGSPLWEPVNLNAGFDLQKYQVDSGILAAGQLYMWRARYRDQNVKWSEWSDTLIFLVQTIGDEPIAEKAKKFFAVPNPTYSSTEIHFSSEEGTFSIRVTDVSGNLVKPLYTGHLERGDHILDWDGTDPSGNMPPAGPYFCTIRGKGFSKTIRIIKL